MEKSPSRARWLPLEFPHFVTILFERSETFDVGGDTFDGGLQHLRIDIGESGPLRFEVRQFVTDLPDTLFNRASSLRNLVQPIETVVVDLPTNIAVAIQRLAVGVRWLKTVFVVVVHGVTLVVLRRTVSVHPTIFALSR